MFEHCLKGLLRGKTIFLATNQLQFIPATDYVISLSETHTIAEQVRAQKREGSGER